ncbi:efflux RND transporter periplasmic adaptor subunit [Arcanobacterium haemolyticum]|uniref:Uncharacterized protein n=1 Tax=Arcanobacterium haemolyticum (strain ATCC 9345 / DSM 20595 / CCM 5947 / CCUG 17215 / LMG 16163 / NBRC 15585 / NCTC 8452 / 11018) TaxID=644284 RepID=D7BMP7_ARCHD|nr:efflux RND transporter periplasmic adaptor subunit [Arcanobacterium haemolyticum]ADH92196.1 conserved hypothetical protein [Arcanobacterium haemolyticum DSM 20595]SQH29098.1 efflux transporter, RND family, MFP subunit [Arcanobacterium haemolyticum]
MDAHPTRKLIFTILRLIITTVIAVAMIKFAFFPSQKTHEPLVGGGEFVMPTVTPTRGDIKNDTEFDATLIRNASKSVKSTAEGEIVHFFVEDGAKIEKGAPILQIKTTTEVTEPPATGSESDDESATPSAPQTRSVVSYNNIVAPATGTLTLDAILKQRVAINDSIGTIAPDSFYASVSVTPDQLYALQSIPKEAEVSIANGPAPFMCTNLHTTTTKSGGDKHEGEAQTSSPQLVCDIPAGQTVFDGIKAKLRITGESATNALLLPLTAVEGRFREGKVYVPAANGQQKPQELIVKLGINDGQMIVITEGLKEDTEVLEFTPQTKNDEQKDAPNDSGFRG